jgi:hypothetical protein
MKDWEKGYWLGILAGSVGTTLAALAILYSSPACAQNWEQSPYNWQNSQYNYNNSSTKWENSPSNWNNSKDNWNSNNGVYDNRGNRIGYETIAPSGTVNYFDNNGARHGYRSK